MFVSHAIVCGVSKFKDGYVLTIAGLILPQVFNAVPMVEDSVGLFG